MLNYEFCWIKKFYLENVGDMETPQHGNGSKISGNPSKVGFSISSNLSDIPLNSNF